MRQTTETTIKMTKDGRAVVYREGSLYIGGSHHTICVLEPAPLSATERATIGAEYTHRMGAVALTDAETKVLQIAIAEDQRTLRAERERPENVERNRIAAIYARAEALVDEDYSRSLYLLSEADAALAAWRVKYQDAAREEERLQLRGKAEHERSLAIGALTYDADGWISQQDQQRNHDEHITKAAEYDRQANEQ